MPACSFSPLSFLSFSKCTTPPRETVEKWRICLWNSSGSYWMSFSLKSTGASFSQKYSMKMTAKPRQTSMCSCNCVYILCCVSVCFAGEWDLLRLSPYGWGNLVAEVEDAPGAFVEGHCPREPRGRSAVNWTQSRRGHIQPRSFEGWRTTAKVKVLQAGVWWVDNKRRRTEAWRESKRTRKENWN